MRVEVELDSREERDSERDKEKAVWSSFLKKRRFLGKEGRGEGRESDWRARQIG